jgi:hypothetical protein
MYLDISRLFAEVGKKKRGTRLSTFILSFIPSREAYLPLIPPGNSSFPYSLSGVKFLTFARDTMSCVHEHCDESLSS